MRYPRQGHGIGETRLAMDRLRRYVCAFTDVLDMASTTESCENGVPVSEVESDDVGEDGMIEVTLPVGAMQSAGFGAEVLDRGIFEVVEPGRR